MSSPSAQAQKRGNPKVIVVPPPGEDASQGESDDEVETELACWVKVQTDAEVARATAQGGRILRLSSKNCGIVRDADDGGRIRNRIEVDTGFNFDKVQQILLSDAMPIPTKPGFELRFLILSTGQPLVLLVPYVYDAGIVKPDDMRNWEFINN
eukprot:CAMPEP_0206825404 /NCGR_PEP_ID=MMETSP0975-20121206/14325_1 /ASSEMBLY_ACC=CAM_ASM_000399 /TAXON_ID=483370 /ORGANISM="non described non described, Strain CCMP2097" /LENGTH=152 /DNA_ID=CAMNT_0054367695 /DNA_START=54 /DNA_END=509 /DNA_ORIENTATION=+